MELKGQEKEIGMPSSSVPHPSNRDSSSKVPSAYTVPASGERRRENQATTQALEGHPPYQHHHHHHQTHKPTRGPDITPDPASSAIAATSATNIAPAAPGRSISGSPPPASTSSSVRYCECLRNHAASAGGLVVDGCGEFMPSGEEGTLEALKCAACECHRNFHRKEIEGEFQYITNSYYKNSSHRTALTVPPQQLATSLPQLQPSLHQHHRHPHALSITRSAAPIAPIMLAFASGAGGGAAADSSSEDLNIFQSNFQGQEFGHPSSSKKRFRTKFSQEQKEKMMEFAEKLEWKIQKQDEQAVQQFCFQLGVERKVFKVWMHNKKQAMKKKEL